MNITTKTTSPQEAKAPATAAGQYLGYSLQQTLLAIRLRKAAEGSACSLEVLDDVAEQAEDGTDRADRGDVLIYFSIEGLERLAWGRAIPGTSMKLNIT